MAKQVIYKGHTKIELLPDKYIFGKNNEYEIIFANTIELRKRAWALVYDNYLQKGFTKKDQHGLWYNLHDALPNTRTLLVVKNGLDVATLTLVFDSALGLPADTLYASELNTMRKAGKHPFEITSLASRSKESLGDSLEVIKHMFRVIHIIASHEEKATDWIATVNPRHSFFYKKVILFEELGSTKAYDKVGGVPAVLLTLNGNEAEEKYRKQYGTKEGSIYHFFFPNDSFKRKIFMFTENHSKNLVWETVKYWFIDKKPLLSKLPPEHLFYIEKEYAAKLL